MKKCPSCSEEIKDEDVKCRDCGVWLEKKEETVLNGKPSQSDTSTEKSTGSPSPTDDRTIDSITDHEFTAFIGKNAAAYIAKFKNFNVGGNDKFKATWHWPAFLFPFFWALYRKLYPWALLAFVLIIIPYFGPVAMIVYGITGNYIYYRHVKKEILELKGLYKSSDEQGTIEIVHAGGVDNFAVVISLILLMAVVGLSVAITW